MKPCFACRQSSPLMFGDRFFDPEAVFESWSAENQIICDWRSRFDGVRRALDWASLDENDDGAHAECALRWAIKESKWDCRYPRIPAGLNAEARRAEVERLRAALIQIEQRGDNGCEEIARAALVGAKDSAK